jgi:hypothetical protein
MSIVALSTSYPSRIGGPVLSAVDTRIFSFRYFRHCLDCSFCHDACCRHGVDVDLENATHLLATPQRFKDMVGVPEKHWFTTDIIADAEFPSGVHVRTQIRNGSCVFHDPNARGCLIHRYCLEEGLDYHTLKPMVSILFPLTFEHGVLVASTEVLDGTLICSGQGPSLYDGAREELGHYFGDVLVGELDMLQNAQ